MERITFEDACYALLSMELDAPRDTGDFTFPLQRGRPSPLFWDLWRHDKPGMKGWGFSVAREPSGAWLVYFNFSIPRHYFDSRLVDIEAPEPENLPYFCAKCKRKHVRGKIYDAHKELAIDKDVGEG